MKNLALIFVALMGAAVVSHAQDGTKQIDPKKTETKRRTPVKQKTIKVEERKKEEKIQKVN